LARVGVVVVTHASAAEITACLTSLPTQELARVVVVDNASPDDTVAVIKALARANVEIVEQANLGFGAGNDAGRARLPAGTEFVLFLNPDCSLERASLRALVDYLDAHPRCALVGPRLESDAAPLTPGGALPTVLTELQPLFPRVLGRLLPRRQLPPDVAASGPVGYVEGACMLVRTEAFDAVGGFDDRYFLCFEEMDLAHRINDNGWTVDVCTDATARHLVQRSRRRDPRLSDYHKYRSQTLYLERWAGRWPARFYARTATALWWVRRATGRIDRAQYEVLKAAVGGAGFPA
jgi:GT2 family glycosyltransferase